jgi:hypothetical protein
LDKNAKKRPASFQTTNSILKKSKYAKKTSGSSTEAHFTEKQVSVMIGQVMASMKEKYGGNKKQKRQVHFSDSDSDSNSDRDSNDLKKIKNENIPYSFAYTYLFDYDRNIEAPMHQRQNTARYSAEIIVEIVDSQNQVVPIRALLDTGTSETILLKPFLSSTSVWGYKGSTVTTWTTLGGDFVTHRKAEIKFGFPELSDKKYITWTTHVDHST